MTDRYKSKILKDIVDCDGRCGHGKIVSEIPCCQCPLDSICDSHHNDFDYRVIVASNMLKSMKIDKIVNKVLMSI